MSCHVREPTTAVQRSTASDFANSCCCVRCHRPQISSSGCELPLVTYLISIPASSFDTQIEPKSITSDDTPTQKDAQESRELLAFLRRHSRFPLALALELLLELLLELEEPDELELLDLEADLDRDRAGIVTSA